MSRTCSAAGTEPGPRPPRGGPDTRRPPPSRTLAAQRKPAVQPLPRARACAVVVLRFDHRRRAEAWGSTLNRSLWASAARPVRCAAGTLVYAAEAERSRVFRPDSSGTHVRHRTGRRGLSTGGQAEISRVMVLAADRPPNDSATPRATSPRRTGNRRSLGQRHAASSASHGCRD